MSPTFFNTTKTHTHTHTYIASFNIALEMDKPFLRKYEIISS